VLAKVKNNLHQKKQMMKMNTAKRKAIVPQIQIRVKNKAIQDKRLY